MGMGSMSFKINPEEILLKFLLMLYRAVVVNQGAGTRLSKGTQGTQEDLKRFYKIRQNKH